MRTISFSMDINMDKFEKQPVCHVFQYSDFARNSDSVVHIIMTSDFKGGTVSIRSGEPCFCTYIEINYSSKLDANPDRLENFKQLVRNFNKNASDKLGIKLNASFKKW